MGFFSGIFGKNSQWDGSQYIEKKCGQKFWHNSFIDKDEAFKYGQEFAMEVDPLGARKRQPDMHTLMGELIYYFQICESRDDENALRIIAKVMSKYMEEFPEQMGIVYFGGQTAYYKYI